MIRQEENGCIVIELAATDPKIGKYTTWVATTCESTLPDGSSVRLTGFAFFQKDEYDHETPPVGTMLSTLEPKFSFLFQKSAHIRLFMEDLEKGLKILEEASQ